MSNVTRRKFLKTTVAMGAMGFARTGLGQRPFSKPRGANDDIRIAVVGIGSNVKIGGKGKQEIRDFLKIPGVRVKALCDPDQNHLYGEVKKFKGRNESVDAYTDVRKLLEDPNIDAVNVVTPNHWHAVASIWACLAGMVFFVLKPASHNLFEGRKLVVAA
jgi:predicted dehydrogenase